jgi:hypothetical protein
MGAKVERINGVLFALVHPLYHVLAFHGYTFVFLRYYGTFAGQV